MIEIWLSNLRICYLFIFVSPLFVLYKELKTRPLLKIIIGWNLEFYLLFYLLINIVILLVSKAFKFVICHSQKKKVLKFAIMISIVFLYRLGWFGEIIIWHNDTGTWYLIEKEKKDGLSHVAFSKKQISITWNLTTLFFFSSETYF